MKMKRLSLIFRCPTTEVTKSCMMCQNVRTIHFTPSSFVVPKNMKGKSVSSQQWMTQHLNDPYVIQANKLGYRARSAFKLLELDKKFKILKPGQVVVDCGAAPGAWTQVAVKKINSDGKEPTKPTGKIASVDLLYIEPIVGAITLQNSDFTDPKVQQEIIRQLTYDPLAEEETSEETAQIPTPLEEGEDTEKKKIFDVVLSDMAPNATGIGDADHHRILKLFRCALDYAIQHGKQGSSFLGKIWNGSDTNILLEELKAHYKVVKITKPNSSRAQSAEMFIYCKGKLIP